MISEEEAILDPEMSTRNSKIDRIVDGLRGDEAQRKVMKKPPLPNVISQAQGFKSDHSQRQNCETVNLSNGDILNTYTIEHPPAYIPECKTLVSRGLQVDLPPKPPLKSTQPKVTLNQTTNTSIDYDSIINNMRDMSSSRGRTQRISNTNSSEEYSERIKYKDTNVSTENPPPARIGQVTRINEQRPKSTTRDFSHNDQQPPGNKYSLGKESQPVTYRRETKIGEPIVRRDLSPHVESKFVDTNVKFKDVKIGYVIEKIYMVTSDGGVEEELYRKTETSVRKEKRLVVSNGQLYGIFKDSKDLDIDAPIKNDPGKRIRDYLKYKMDNVIVRSSIQSPKIQQYQIPPHIKNENNRIDTPQKNQPAEYRPQKQQHFESQEPDNRDNNHHDSFTPESLDYDRLNQFMKDEEDDHHNYTGRDNTPSSHTQNNNDRSNNRRNSFDENFMNTNPNSRPSTIHAGIKLPDVPHYQNRVENGMQDEETPGFKKKDNDKKDISFNPPPNNTFTQKTYNTPSSNLRSSSLNKPQNTYNTTNYTNQTQIYTERKEYNQPPPVYQAQPQPNGTIKPKEPVRIRYRMENGKRIPVAIDNDDLGEKEKRMILENYLKKDGFTMDQIQELLDKGEGRSHSPRPLQQDVSNPKDKSVLPPMRRSFIEEDRDLASDRPPAKQKPVSNVKITQSKITKTTQGQNNLNYESDRSQAQPYGSFSSNTLGVPNQPPNIRNSPQTNTTSKLADDRSDYRNKNEGDRNNYDNDFSKNQFKSMGFQDETSFDGAKSYFNMEVQQNNMDNKYDRSRNENNIDDRSRNDYINYEGKKGGERDYRPPDTIQGNQVTRNDYRNDVDKFEAKLAMEQSQLSGKETFPGPKNDSPPRNPTYTINSNIDNKKYTNEDNYLEQGQSRTLYQPTNTDTKPKVTLSPPQQKTSQMFARSKLSSTMKAQKRFQSELEKTENMPFEIIEEEENQREGRSLIDNDRKNSQNPYKESTAHNNQNRVVQTESDRSRIGNNNNQPTASQINRRNFGLESNLSSVESDNNNMRGGFGGREPQSNLSSMNYSNNTPRQPQRVNQFESQMSSNYYESPEVEKYKITNEFEKGNELNKYTRNNKEYSNDQYQNPPMRRVDSGSGKSSVSHQEGQVNRSQYNNNNQYNNSRVNNSKMSSNQGGRDAVGFSAFGSVQSVIS